MVGSGDSAGQLPVPGLPTMAYGRAGACCACNRCRTSGLFFVLFYFILFYFHLVYPIFLF